MQKISEQMLLTSCLIAIYLTGVCYSSTFISPAITHPEYPGKCYEPLTKTLVKPGKSVDVPNQCLKLTCLKDLRFSGVTCGSQQVADGNCKVVEGDLSLPYPDCCPTFDCEDFDDVKINVITY